MNVFDLSAKITMDINGYLKGMDTAKAVALSTMSVVGGAVSGFMDESVNVGKRFDSSMSQVAATMGKSMDEMADQTGHANTAFGEFDGTLRDFAQYMGRNTAFTASQAADALNYMALAGYSTQESMDMLPNVLSLAAAGNFDLARASDMVTDTQTAFGISAGRTTKMVDEMAKAASTGNTSVEQLGDAFLVVGGLAQELNGGMVELEDGTMQSVDGIQELEIALTAMANAGVKGSEAGTHMRNMLLKLSSPTDAGTQALEEMGVAIFDADGKMRSLSDIFGDLNTQLSTMTQEQKIQTISELFNTRDLASAEALLNAVGEDWDKIGASILKADGAAAKMAETQLDNLAGDTKLFESALEGAQIALSDAVTPALRFMRQTGTEAILDLTDKFKALPPEAQTAIGLIADFGGKALSVAPQITGLASNISTMQIAMKMSGGTGFIGTLKGIGSAVGPATVAIAALTGAYLLAKSRIKAATEAQQEFLDEIQGAGSAYEATHDQIQLLVDGNNEYISSEDRIAQLEAMRVEARNAQIQAEQNMIKAEQDNVNVQGQLATAYGENTSSLLGYDGAIDQVSQTTTELTEGTGVLNEKNKLLTQSYEEASATYEQSTADLAAIDVAIEEAKAEQEALTTSVSGTASAYSNFSEEIPQEVVDSATQIVGAVQGMQESLTSGVQSIGNWFDEVAKQEEKSAETMKANLQAQIDHVRDWEKDLNYLADKGINKEFLKYLANMGPEASSYVTAMKNDIINGSQATVDEWNALYKEKLDLETGVNDEAENIYSAIANMEAGSESAFNEVISYFGLKSEEAGKGITSGLIDALEGELKKVEEAGEDVGESTIDGLDDGAGVHSPSWKANNTGKNIGLGLALGIAAQLFAAQRAGQNLGSNAISGLNSANLYGNGYSIGQQFDNGLANGMYGFAGVVANAAASVARSAINATKNTMQIQSPSKVGAYIGEMWDKGIGYAVEDFADIPISAARDMAEGMVAETDYGMTLPEYDYIDDSGYYSDASEGEYDYQTLPAEPATNITMNIYGAEGQDIRELAEIISEELADMMREEKAAWA